MLHGPGLRSILLEKSTHSQKTYRLVQATKRGTKFNGLTKDEADDLSRLIAELRKFVIEKMQLYHVDWNYPIQLFTDASKFGIGGMAYQEIGGEMRPLMYISRSVSDAEKKYEDLLFPANTAAHETRQIELLALIFCLEEVSTTLGVLQGRRDRLRSGVRRRREYNRKGQLKSKLNFLLDFGADLSATCHLDLACIRDMTHGCLLSLLACPAAQPLSLTR